MSLTLIELDSLIKTYTEKRADYEAAKKISTDKYNEAEAAKIAVIQALTKADKKSYQVDGLARVSLSSKLVVRVPKDLEAKQKFFEYLRGRGVFEEMVTVHSATLNSFYNAEVEAANEKGVFPFSVPGIEEPTEQVTLSLRKVK